jgi:2-oxo-4-hydroxy-4-carboxy-5-ureidoimidazoline decarboxylase
LNPVLARWHTLPPDEAATEILSCCGSHAWAATLVAMRPFRDQQSLFAAADHCWQNLPQADWLEAFRSHPRIGEKHDDRCLRRLVTLRAEPDERG